MKALRSTNSLLVAIVLAAVVAASFTAYTGTVSVTQVPVTPAGMLMPF